MSAALTTEVPGLDVLTGGGLPWRQSIVVTGEPGSGKTVLCSQIAFSLARRGMPVVIATVTSEPHDKLIQSLKNFSFFDGGMVGEEVFFVSAYPWLKKGARETRDVLLSAVRERGAKLLFIDGLRSVRDLWQDEATLREFLYELNVGLGAADCISLMSTEYPLSKLVQLAEATTVDGVIAVSTLSEGSRRFRRIEVAKLRGVGHISGEHLMQISDAGVTVTPRLESVTRARTLTPTRDRAAFDLPELDALVQGGMPRGSTTLVAGSTGIGKTLLAAQFLAAGARTGERGLLLSFSEAPETIIERATRVQSPIAEGVSKGLVEIQYHPPLDFEADAMIDHLLRRVRETGATRVVIDSLGLLQETILERRRETTLLGALVVELRNLGVTSVFTKEISKLAGPEIDFSDTPIVPFMENFLFLRFVELAGRLHRVLSVLKMRDSEYDGDVRAFTISDQGFKVLDPVNSAEGLLTGQARPIGDAVAPAGPRA